MKVLSLSVEVLMPCKRSEEPSLFCKTSFRTPMGVTKLRETHPTQAQQIKPQLQQIHLPKMLRKVTPKAA